MTHRLIILLAICFAIPQLQVRSDEIAEKLILATYKLSNDASTASGFVVHRVDNGSLKYFVITADHVLRQMKGNTCKLVSRMRQESGTYERQEIELTIRMGGKELWRADKGHDVAALPLADDLNVVSVPYECLATEQALEQVYAGDRVLTAVFPERIESNGAGFPIMRGGTIASYPLRPVNAHVMFLVDVNSWKGDSGAAVMHANVRHENDWPLILGYTRGMQNITDTVKESRFVTKRTDYPLGVSVVGQAIFCAAVGGKLLNHAVNPASRRAAIIP